MHRLIIHSQDHLRIILQSTIKYCKSDNCYTTIHLDNNEEHVVCKSLTKIIKELDQQMFIRVNQSYVVNKHHIRLIDKQHRYLILTGNRQIPFTSTITTLLKLISLEITAISA